MAFSCAALSTSHCSPDASRLWSTTICLSFALNPTIALILKAKKLNSMERLHVPSVLVFLDIDFTFSHRFLRVNVYVQMALLFTSLARPLMVSLTSGH